jgi:hypothetical protein
MSTNFNKKNSHFPSEIKVNINEKRFEDTKVVISRRKSKKDRQHNGQKNKTKGQTTIYKSLHRKLKIKQHESHLKPVNLLEKFSKNIHVYLKTIYLIKISESMML